MNLKKTLIATGIWMLVIIVFSVAAIMYIASQDLPNSQLNERTAMFGSGMGLFAGIGLAVIWLPFAARMGAEKRAQREKAARRKKKR